jgi:hypothetical protein
MRGGTVKRQARGRLPFLLGLCALLLIAAGAWNGRAQAADRILPEEAQLLDPDMVSYCRGMQAALADGQFDRLEAEGRSLMSLHDRLKGGIEKLVYFYNAISNPGCGGFDCRADYRPHVPLLQAWLNRSPRQPTAWIANAWFWEGYAWRARDCAYFASVTFDAWQTFFDRIRVARSYLDHPGLQSDPAFYLLSLSMLRDSGGTRQQIDAMFHEGHAAFPKFLRLDAQYADLLDPAWYGKDGDLGWFAETLLNDPGGEEGQMAYAAVAEEEALRIPYPHLFLETGLRWDRTKPGLSLIEQKYGAANYDWNVTCYMALVAIDRPVALDAYKHFAPLWNPAVWSNEDYFYDHALPWITQGQEP